MGTVASTPTRRRFIRRSWAGLFVVLAVLLAVGLAVVVRSWGEEAESTAEATDALIGPDYYASTAAVCGLLEPDDLTMALGREFSQGVEPDIADPAFGGITAIVRCRYPSPEGAGATVGVVYAYAEQVFERRKAQMRDLDEVTEVDDLGDEAFYGHAGRELLVLVDDTMVGILTPIISASVDDRIELATRLADKALERLR